MAKPTVTCGADIVDVEASLPRVAALSASATGSPTQWLWTMQSVPLGSSADVGVNGDFTNGESTDQNPSFTADVRGTFVCQAMALNGEGWSVPTEDKENGQQNAVIKSTTLDLPIPGDKQYDWAANNDEVLRKLEAAAVAPVAAHAIGSLTHDQSTLAELSARVSDAALIPSTDSRLVDARTPTAHKTTHESGGGDVVDHDALLNYLIAQHRIINDVGGSTTELWSASKISAAIAASSANMDLKDSVETVSTSDITLFGEQLINGVTTSVSRVGVVGQSTGSENGIYISGAAGWTRAADADSDAEVTQGLTFYVADGDKKGNQYVLLTADPITVGGTALVFTEVPRIVLGTTSGTACAGDDSRLPVQDENDALVGTDGTPSSANKYVTDSDSRLTDDRDPTNHAGDHNSGGGDAMAIDAAAGVGSLRTIGTGALTACAGNDGRLADARTPTSHGLAGSEHSADTLSNLNGKVSDHNLGGPVSAEASTPVTVAATDSGKVFTNEGSAAEIEFDLPTAAPGLEYTFVVQDGNGIQVNAAAGDTIRVAASVSAAAGLIEAAVVGNTVKIKAINVTEWVALFYVGTWTVT